MMRRRRPCRVDLEGIERRVVAFPVPDARYGQIMGIPDKALFTVFPLEGALDSEQSWESEEPEAGELRAYDFKDYKAETLLENLNEFDLSANGKKLVYRLGSQLRVIDAGAKPPSGGGARARAAGSTCSASRSPSTPNPSGSRCSARRGVCSAITSGLRTCRRWTGRPSTGAISS